MSYERFARDELRLSSLLCSAAPQAIHHSSFVIASPLSVHLRFPFPVLLCPLRHEEGRLNAAVESDVVGYTTMTIKPGYNLIAFNFQPLDGSEEISIQDFITNKDDLIASSNSGLADQIQIWNGTSFDVYYYTPSPYGNVWVSTKAITTIAEATIPRGSGVWFARPTGAAEGKITISGKVGVNDATHTIKAGYNMISAAFPADMPLNTNPDTTDVDESQDCPIDWDACGAVASSNSGLADQIQIWNGTSFDVYYYTPSPYGNVWVSTKAITTISDVKVPAGAGFWYARPAGSIEGELTEKSPLAE